MKLEKVNYFYICSFHDILNFKAYHHTCVRPCNDVTQMMEIEEDFSPALFGALDYANMTPEDLPKSVRCGKGYGGIVIQFGRNVEYEIVRAEHQRFYKNILKNLKLHVAGGHTYSAG